MYLMPHDPHSYGLWLSYMVMFVQVPQQGLDMLRGDLKA
jgi:hypothetical protein